MKKTSIMIITAVSLFVGISAVTIPIAFAEKNSNTIYDDTEHIDYNYPVNESGLTYGADNDSIYSEDLPDLMLAVGDNGKQGYVYREEFNYNPVSTPEQAAEYMRLLESGQYIPRTLNVYEADGKTVIDTLTEQIPDQYKHLYN
ncbi:MAG: hypothetical protein J5501_03840 [Ruminococcus sp.]|nr:hypothetical protein [Ruminococcus sp.]